MILFIIITGFQSCGLNTTFSLPSHWPGVGSHLEFAEQENILLPFKKNPGRQAKEHFPLKIVEQGIVTYPFTGDVGFSQVLTAT